MPWLRLDDGYADHPKILELTERDRWRWTTVLLHCARYQTHGHVSAGALRACRIGPALLHQLETLRLLEPIDGAGAHRVHDWTASNAYDAEGLERHVADLLERFPNASANEIARLVNGRRQEVLRIVREHRDTADTAPGGSRNPRKRATTPRKPRHVERTVNEPARTVENPADPAPPQGKTVPGNQYPNGSQTGVARARPEPDPGTTTPPAPPPAAVDADQVDAQRRRRAGGREPATLEPIAADAAAELERLREAFGGSA